MFKFKRSAGKSWVEAGRYTITDESTGGVVLTNAEWNGGIKLGMKLSMAMVIQKPSSYTAEHSCPACQLTYAGVDSTNLERIKWQVGLSPMYRYGN